MFIIRDRNLLKACIFPNDPLKSYLEKGEIKKNYFNPNNIFDEIHVISLTDSDVSDNEIKILFGSALFRIHCVGKIGIKDIGKNKDRILKLVKEIEPNVIRAYNTLTEGWLAAYCSKNLNISLFVSIHIQYDNLRKQYMKTDIKKYLKLKYSEKKIEPYVLKTAAKITAVYKIIDPYVVRLCNIHPEIVYNGIDYERFANAKRILSYDKPLVISVGRLTKQKHHDVLIHAMESVDAKLLIVGDGELRDQLQSLVKKLKLDEKIIFKRSVPNTEIQDYYKSAKIFVLAYDTAIEGIPIPIMEAMAAGLPVIIPRPQESLSDGLEGSVIFVDQSSESFANAIKRLLTDKNLYETLSKHSKHKAREFDISEVVKKEAAIYLSLIKHDH